MSTGKRIEIGGAATGWLLPALILAGWEVAARVGLISANVLPAPSAVAEAFWRLLLSGELIANIGVSSAAHSPALPSAAPSASSSGSPMACLDFPAVSPIRRCR